MFSKLLFRVVKRFRHSAAPGWAVLLIDMLLFTVAFLVAEAFALRSFSNLTLSSLLFKYLLSASITLLFFLLFRSYKNIIRHMGLNDIFRVLLVCVFPAVACVVINFINNKVHLLPSHYLLSYRAVAMLYSMLAVLMLLGRFTLLYIYNQYFRRQRLESNVIIYGAGAAGVIANNALKQDIHYEYKVVAFVDDDRSKINQQLDGIPVMRARDALNEKFVEKNKVNQLIIAIPTVKLIHKQAITNRGLDLGLTVKSVPHISMWMNGTFSSNQIQDIRIEDLLEREPTKVDDATVMREVLDKVVLVTGAAGSIGVELCRRLLHYKPKQLVMVDQSEPSLYDLQYELLNTDPYKGMADSMRFVVANVREQTRMEELFDLYRPDLVYHAAAYKQVPMMEESPYEAVHVNVFGTKTVADLAMKYEVGKVVYVSDDKAVNPTNVLGASMRLAEMYVQSRPTVKTQFVITRFGNVLGGSGSVIPLFKKQLEAGGPLTVTHKEMTRFFMTIPEACGLILEAGAMGKGGDIYVFDMGKPVKIYDLAYKMIQLSGLKGVVVKEVGLRPGEKLYDELLMSNEDNESTSHKKILRVKQTVATVTDVDRQISELEDVMWTLDSRQIVAKMKTIVPEYISNNSIYSDLDN